MTAENHCQKTTTNNHPTRIKLGMTNKIDNHIIFFPNENAAPTYKSGNIKPQIKKRGVAEIYSDIGNISIADMNRSFAFLKLMAKIAMKSETIIKGQNSSPIKPPHLSTIFNSESIIFYLSLK